MSNREMHNTSLIWNRLTAAPLPLHKQVESGHYECKPGSQVSPCPAAQLLDVTHIGEHREHIFDDHTIIPAVRLAYLHIRGISSFAKLSMKAGVGQHHHLLFVLGDERSEDVVPVISRVGVPP